ncbi:MAG: cell surface protein, partial [Prochlorococcus marinus XMU1423]|nr:cell surface protein [Prochlorococcus marinus XMU1423]
MKLLGLNSPEIFIILVICLSILGPKRIEKGLLLFKKLLKFLLSKDEDQSSVNSKVKQEEAEESEVKEEIVEPEVKAEEAEESEVKEEIVEPEVKAEEAEESEVKEEIVEPEVKAEE